MLKLKRTVALLLALLCLCTPVFAQEKQTATVSSDRAGYSFSININTEKFVDYLVESLMTCPKKLDISSFGIPHTTQDAIALQETIWHDAPLLFHVNGIGYTGSNGIIDYVYFTYHYTAEEYVAMYEECRLAADDMISDLRGNTAIDDVTKALLVHDRLIVNCEYDYKAVNAGNISNESQEMYGALVNGLATCQGYSYAYMYLLGELGIDSYICSSVNMGHDWNIVILNGKKYHVDVTFDDPIYDVTGRVYHDYFLRSTQAMKKGEHNFTDYDSSPTDTTYDNYYWRDSKAEFQLIDNKVYYINNEKETLNRVGTGSSLGGVSDAWTTSDGKYWIGNFSRLSSDGKNLFYSLSDAVYVYDISTQKAKSVYKPGFSGEAGEIYGFTYDGGYLVIDRYNKPNFDKDTKDKYQIRVPYDLSPPTASLTYTNEVAAYQTVSIKLSDNNGISGYYWGKYQDHTENPFTATTSTSAKEYVSESGTYYLTAKDSGGNISDTVSVTFCSTRLEVNGGAVGTPNILTPKGYSFTLPIPTRDGYVFTGWSTSNSGDDKVTSVTPLYDAAYYAGWELDENYEPATNPEYNNRFTDVADSAWYADAVAYCATRGYINGISDTLFSPNANLTREQFVMILANVAGVDADGYKYADSGMTDVPQGRWYSGAIAWGVAEGYVKGVSSDRFGLRQNITREQLARLFYVYAEDIGIDVEGRADLSRYKDASKVSDWALENVRWAVYSGIISGMTKDTVAPRGYATRAQAARMFMIFSELV